VGNVVSIVFSVLLHILFFGAMIAFAVVLVRTALSSDQPRERFFRFLALFLGAMIVLGAQVSGVSFSVFAAGALSQAQVSSAGAAIVSGIIPALAGTGLGFYMVYVYRKRDPRAFRVLCFVGMLSLASFLTVYAIALNANGLFLGAAAIPNLTFTAGVGLVILFGAEKRTEDGPSAMKQFLADRLGRAKVAVTLFGGHFERENVHHGKQTSGVHS